MIPTPQIYDEATEQRGIAEIHVAKQRNGPLGVETARFDGPTTRFTPLEQRHVREGW